MAAFLNTYHGRIRRSARFIGTRTARGPHPYSTLMEQNPSRPGRTWPDCQRLHSMLAWAPEHEHERDHARDRGEPPGFRTFQIREVLHTVQRFNKRLSSDDLRLSERHFKGEIPATWGRHKVRRQLSAGRDSFGWSEERCGPTGRQNNGRQHSKTRT